MRRKTNINWKDVGLGEKPDIVIANKVGETESYVRYIRKKMKIRSSRQFLLFQEGTPCRSMLEAKYDAYLHSINKIHIHEESLIKLGIVADFLIDNTYVEVCGMMGFKKYDIRFRKKLRKYKAAKLKYKMVFADEVEKLYDGCGVDIKYSKIRVCSLCKKKNNDLVKGVCRGSCYMKYIRAARSVHANCEFCGAQYNHSIYDEHKKFCSIECYWNSLVKKIDISSINEQLKTKSIRQIALDTGINYSTLYSRIKGIRLENH